jgi:hypothetical protein
MTVSARLVRLRWRKAKYTVDRSTVYIAPEADGTFILTVIKFVDGHCLYLLTRFRLFEVKRDGFLLDYRMRSPGGCAV